MKKVLFITLMVGLFAAFTSTYAQYGFGTNAPNPNAIIDAQGTQMGLLIPRVTLTGANDNWSGALDANANSMIVYHLGSTGLTTPGYYYWSWVGTGGTWIKLSDGANNNAVLSAGTGITAFSYNGTATATVGLANTTVNAGTYGSAALIPTFTVDAQGRLTAAGTVAPDIANLNADLTTSGGLTGGPYDGSITKDISIIDGGVTSAKIFDGAIMNVDINTAAQIDVNKLAEGTNGYILKSNGTDVVWAAPTTLAMANLTPTTNGGLTFATGTEYNGSTARELGIAPGGVTNDMLAGSIANGKLVNDHITIGTTDIALGGSSTTLAGLTSVTSTSFVGALTGNASTATLLQNARNFSVSGDAATAAAVSFNGGADVVLPVTIQATAGNNIVTALNNAATTNGTLANDVLQLTAGALLYGNSTNGAAELTKGTAGQVLKMNAGATAPEWASLSTLGVTSFSGGSTGLTPAAATTGDIVLAGTLAIANGGTGATTATGAINNLLPTQTSNAGTVLTTNGTAASWGTVANLMADLTAGTGLNFSVGGPYDGSSVATIRIADGGVGTTQLADNAVTTAKISDANVTGPKLAAAVAGLGLSQNVSGNLDVNVDGSTIELNGDILRVKAAGITANELATDAVTNAKVANDAINTAEIVNNAVTYAKMQNLSAVSRLLGSSSTTTPVQEITLGSGLSMTGTTLSASGLGGTVTSFSSGNLSPLFTTSVATATTTPALSFTLSDAAAHKFLGNNTGTTGAPAYVAITDDDVPNNITVNLAATVTTNADLTGPVTSVGNATSITDKAVTTSKILGGNQYEVLTSTTANGTSWNLLTNDNIATGANIAVAKLSAGTDGYILKYTTGGGVAWASPTSLAMLNLTNGDGIQALTYNGSATQTVAVNVDGTTINFDASSPKKIQVADGGISSAKIADLTIVNADIATGAAIDITKLAASTITLTSTGSSLTVPGSPISLGGTGNLDLNMAHTNNWTAAQTFVNATISGTLTDGKTTPSVGTAGQVLTSTGTSIAWVDPGAVNIVETDPQVSSSINNRIPKWSTGVTPNTLVDGIITDNGTSASVGGNLAVTGTSTLTGNVDATGGLDVTGAALTAAAGVTFTGTGFAAASTDNNILTYNTSTGAVGYRPFTDEAIRGVSGTLTLLITDGTVIATAASTLTLPTTGLYNGKKIIVKNGGTGYNVSVSGGGNNIDGTGTYNLNANYQSATFQWLTNQWYVVGIK